MYLSRRRNLFGSAMPYTNLPWLFEASRASLSAVWVLNCLRLQALHQLLEDPTWLFSSPYVLSFRGFRQDVNPVRSATQKFRTRFTLWWWWIWPDWEIGASTTRDGRVCRKRFTSLESRETICSLASSRITIQTWLSPPRGRTSWSRWVSWWSMLCGRWPRGTPTPGLFSSTERSREKTSRASTSRLRNLHSSQASWPEWSAARDGEAVYSVWTSLLCGRMNPGFERGSSLRTKRRVEASPMYLLQLAISTTLREARHWHVGCSRKARISSFSWPATQVSA